jgi:uncharacterized protein
MRVLLDTNVLVAAFLTRGTCHDVLETCLVRHVPCTSEHILGELSRALRAKTGVPDFKADRALRLVRRNSEVVEHGPLAEPVCRDPEDDHILAAAAAGEVDCIVTGDEDLLVLGSHAGIPIIAPAAFWPLDRGRR